MNVVSAGIGFAGRIVDAPAWAQALFAALWGAGLAWAYYFGGTTAGVSTLGLGLGLLSLVAVLSWIASWVGGQLIGKRVLLGVRLMGIRAWLEIALGATGVAIAVWIAASVVPTEAKPSDVTKAVVAGWAAGLSAAVTAGLAKRAEDTDSRVGDAVRAVAEKVFKDKFDEDSDPWQAVYSGDTLDVSGWGRTAREKRAVRIQAGL